MGWFGTQPGIDRIVHDHYEIVYRFAHRLSGDRAEAEDITQETFCQAQTNLHQLREEKATRSWLFTIARNLYLRRIRSRKVEKTIPLEGVAELIDRNDPDVPAIDPAQLQIVLGQLPEPFRSPLLLYYFENRSYREIAEQIGIPLGTVMSRLARAKDFLRSRLTAAEPALAFGRKERA